MLPSSGFKIARVFGIDIVINATWLIIFFLVAISFGSMFRSWPLESGRSFPGGPWPWVAGFLTGAVFFACLLAHELSHSYVAKRNNIPIKRITLFLFGGVAEMSEDVQSAGAEFRMAIAGPLVTFILAGIFYLLFRLAESWRAGPLFVAPPYSLAGVNLFIGVFNLLPGFPLDGGRVLRSLLWKVTGNLKKATRIATIAGQVCAVLIAGFGLYLLATGNVVSGIWLMFIGLFFYRLAQASYRQTLLRVAASDTVVRDIMYTDVPMVDARTTLTSLKTNYFTQYSLPAFPVEEAGEVTGVVSRDDVIEVSPAEWDLLNVGRVATPLPEVSVVPPDTPLDRVIRQLLGGEHFLLVMEGNEVLGIVTREELVRYVDMRLKLTRKK